MASVLLAGCCLCKTTTSTPPDFDNGAASGPLKAGAAVVGFNLPNAPSLAGYGGAPRRITNASTIALAGLALGAGCFDPDPTTAAVFFAPATGTRDPLGARALVLDNGKRKIAIVKLDTIGISRKLRDDLVEAALPRGIDATHLALVASHTHSGPGGVADQKLWQVAASDCYADKVYKAVRDAAKAALANADDARQPARLGIGATVVQGANENRRQQPNVVDRELGVVKVTTATGSVLAALFNFAVHGTSYGADNMRFSADCMGAMEAAVESKLPGVVAIFTNGAEGDVSPVHRDEAGVQLQGQTIADALAMLWPGITTKSTIDLRAAFQDVPMPAPRYNPSGCLPLAGTASTLCDIVGSPVTVPLHSSWLSTKLPFQAFRIDDTAFVTIPGEPVTQIGWNLKAHAQQLGFSRGFVLGLANDHGGYFTTVEQYQAGTYEGTSTLYGQNTGSIVTNSAMAVMDLVK